MALGKLFPRNTLPLGTIVYLELWCVILEHNKHRTSVSWLTYKCIRACSREGHLEQRNK
ncbi:hypothetical protein DsansV1_C01g0008121 [Dioscorea sansibarensis]